MHGEMARSEDMGRPRADATQNLMRQLNGMFEGGQAKIANTVMNKPANMPNQAPGQVQAQQQKQEKHQKHDQDDGLGMEVMALAMGPLGKIVHGMKAAEEMKTEAPDYSGQMVVGMDGTERPAGNTNGAPSGASTRLAPDRVQKQTLPLGRFKM